MSEAKVLKAEIKDWLFLSGKISEELRGHSKKDSSFNCTVPVHDDLKTAFGKLNIHLALLCDQLAMPTKKAFAKLQVLMSEAKIVEGEGKNSDREDPFFHVYSFSISGNEENEAIVISGYMEGTYGEVDLSNPPIKWDNTDYPFSDQLSEDAQACIYEVKEYLFNEKRAPEKQLEMEFAEGEGDEEGATEE